MKALIITDYTYDFVAEDGCLTAGKPAQGIDGAIAQAVGETLAEGGLVFVVNDLHLEGDHTHPESRLFPPHNIKGSPGRRVYGRTGALLEANGELVDRQIFWLDKFRYSCCEGTPLDQLLRQYGVDSLEITGVCTDICVLHTAISAYNLGYPVTVHDNRVASFNALGHTWALAHFKETLGFSVVKEEEA